MNSVKRLDDHVFPVLSVQQRQKIGVYPPMEQRVERLGDKKHLSVADQAKLEMWHKNRSFYSNALGGNRSQWPVFIHPSYTTSE